MDPHTQTTTLPGTLPSNPPKSYSVDFPEDQIDLDARKVLRRLAQHGFEACLVGGCVRDLLLGVSPKDFDIATSARPNQIRKIFRNCRIIGRRFRLAHILFANQKVIEVATFRANAETGEVPEAPSEQIPEPLADATSALSDESMPETSASANPEESLLIRDDNVFGTAETDALRRDFTINAFFYDVEKKVVLDFVGGWEHVKARQLVMIGDPDRRLREDPVRMIRAAKFAQKLGLTIEANLFRSLKERHGDIAQASPARVVDEIFKILSGRKASDVFVMLHEIGILEHILPFLADDLRGGSSGDQSTYWRYIRALEKSMAGERTPSGDEPSRSFAKPTRAVFFAALIAPTIESYLVGEEPNRDALLSRVQELGVSMRNPKRETYRAQQMMLAQERLERGARPEVSHHEKRTRRHSGPQKFAERNYFAESLQFLWLRALANEDEELFRAYRSWAPWFHVAPGGFESPRRHDRSSQRSQVPGNDPRGGSRGRRRRRGGRNRFRHRQKSNDAKATPRPTES